MSFVQRTKSANAVEQSKRGRKDEAVAEHRDASPKDRRQKTARSQERPKTAGDDKRSRSFSRPRTATRATDHTNELQGLGQTIEIKAGNETFNFPTPSPRLPPKSATFHASPSPLSVRRSPSIGVALGSPSQVAMPAWGRSHTADHVSTRMPLPPQPMRAPPQIPNVTLPDEQIRRKKSWKVFGGLFGRKAAKSTIEEPFYKLKVPEEHGKDPNYLYPRSIAASTPSPRHSPLPQRWPIPQRSPSSPGGQPRRTPSITRGIARFEARAEADLASFNPDVKPKKMRSPSMVQKEGFSPMFRALGQPRDSEDMFRPDHMERNDSPMSMNEKPCLSATPSTPRLDLEIPDSKFERYSVMFEKLLEEPKPSLLERRQSRLQSKKSLKTLDPVESVAEEGSTPQRESSGLLQRSITSPHIKKTLSIRIGKKADNAVATTAEQGTAIHRPRPIQRSKTTAAGAPSPLAQSFAKAKMAILGRSPRSPAFAENVLPPTPMTAATLSDSDSVAVIENDLNNLQRNMDQAGPNWDMITSKPAKLDVSDRPDPYLRVKSPADLEKQIVQVSVARQVSVSKARQQVQQAVASKQPLRPRIVELSKDRKSTVVLIETEED